MKIGYFNNTNIRISETFVYDLLKGIFEKHEEIIYFSGEQEQVLIDFNIKSKNVGFNHESTFLNLLQKISLKLPRFKSVYHTRKVKSTNKKLTLAQAQLVNVAYVDYATNGILLMDFFKKHEIPFIVHVHGHDITSKMRDPYYKKQFQELTSSCAYFVVASHAMKRLLILNGCPDDKIKVIRLGVDSENIIPISWEEKLKNHTEIVSLGRLTPKKNPIASLYAFKLVNNEIPESTYTIIGDGELKPQLIKKIKELNLENKVQLLGALPRHEAFKALQNKSVFIQHSVTALTGDQEGFAISLAEAQMFKIPVVSTIHNGITENVINNKTGFLVQEYDYEAMAQKIILLLKNKTMCQEFGEAGRQHILSLCNTDNRVNSILNLLLELNKKQISKQ